jgi:hypothetical protein
MPESTYPLKPFTRIVAGLFAGLALPMAVLVIWAVGWSMWWIALSMLLFGIEVGYWVWRGESPAWSSTAPFWRYLGNRRGGRRDRSNGS